LKRVEAMGLKDMGSGGKQYGEMAKLYKIVRVEEGSPM